MENPIKLIHKFNQQAGLLDKPYSDFLESSFQIEEALEGFADRNLDRLGHRVFGGEFPYKEKLPKHIARMIMLTLTPDKEHTPYHETFVPLSDLERLDKACDAVVFAVGSMAKLGLNPQQITRALNIVMQANMAKLSMPKDEFGKLMKPTNFVGPEVALQSLLDERNSK